MLSTTTVNIPLEGFGPDATLYGPSGTAASGGDEEVKRLRYQHELWKKYAPLWKFYLDAYEGGVDFANEHNLFKHARENDEDYYERVERVHNLNYCEPLVDFFTNFIFSEAIDRTGGSNNDFYIDFTKDVNKREEGINEFMRQVSDDMQIFGMSYVLVDAPPMPSDETSLSKFMEQYAGLRPYWVLIRPDEIIDWVVDEFGIFQYAKRVQDMSRVVDGRHRKIERYTEFYADHILVSEIDSTDPAKVTLLGSKEFPNRLGKIPLKVARYKRSKRDPHMGLSFLRDFAFNNREIMNLTSLLQEFLYRQAFNILAKEVETGIPIKEQEDGSIGTANVMEVPKGAAMPQYISPPADPAKFIQDERGRIKNEMYVRAAQDALSELFNGEARSGYSQAQSFSKTVPHIASRADTLERMENDLMSLTMEMMGQAWDGKIKYKDRYELTNLTSALAQLQTLVRDFMLPSETFVKEELKRMVREFDGKLPVDTLMKVEKEIDSMDFNDWLEKQTQALVGKGASPDSTSTRQTTPDSGMGKTTEVTTQKE